MEQFRAETYLMQNKSLLFPNDKYNESQVMNALMAFPGSDLELQGINYSDTTISLVLAIFLGSVGADRFYLGDTGKGVLKLVTCGACGFWSIVDMFTVSKRCRALNCEKLMEALNNRVNSYYPANFGIGSAPFHSVNNAPYSPIDSGKVMQNTSSTQAQYAQGANHPMRTDSTDREKLSKAIDVAKKVAPLGKSIVKGAKDIRDSFEVR